MHEEQLRKKVERQKDELTYRSLPKLGKLEMGLGLHSALDQGNCQPYCEAEQGQGTFSIAKDYASTV